MAGRQTRGLLVTMGEAIRLDDIDQHPGCFEKDSAVKSMVPSGSGDEGLLSSLWLQPPSYEALREPSHEALPETLGEAIRLDKFDQHSG